MQKKKLEQQLTNPPKTQQQLKFESQWKASEPKPAEAKPAPLPPQQTQPQPSTSQAVIPLPEADKFDEDEFEDSLSFEKTKNYDQNKDFDIPQSFDNLIAENPSSSRNSQSYESKQARSSRNYNSESHDHLFNREPFDSNETSFDHCLPREEDINTFRDNFGKKIHNHSLPREETHRNINIPFHRNINSRNEIPGLDLQPQYDEPMELIDLDEDQDYLPEDDFFMSNPPPVPSFKRPNRIVVDISNILDHPGRNNRPNR
jgi:hypothetical protein